MDAGKEYIYKQRFYPIGVRGGKWVKLWNWGVEAERLWWKYLCEASRARSEKLLKKWMGR